MRGCLGIASRHVLPPPRPPPSPHLNLAAPPSPLPTVQEGDLERRDDDGAQVLSSEACIKPGLKPQPVFSGLLGYTSQHIPSFASFATERMITDRKHKVFQVQGKGVSFLSGRDRGRPLATEFLQKILSEVSRNSKENGFCVRPKNHSPDGVIIPSPWLLACVVK